jgi:hypothetical protein
VGVSGSRNRAIVDRVCSRSSDLHVTSLTPPATTDHTRLTVGPFITHRRACGQRFPGLPRRFVTDRVETMFVIVLHNST